MNRKISVRRQQQQRGSALLVVLVFAAIIAIMLYRELPIAAFEAQRQREQLVVSRGEEYKRGIKLFVRKIGRFPSSLDELENTNRMRFLRHRFADPLTGKDDWRLIHAGPGGIILDSKVATNTNNKNASTLGQGTTFAGFANSFNGDTAAVAAAAADNTPSAGMRQRPPATKNAASETVDPLAAITGVPNAEDAANPNLAGAVQSIDPVTGQPSANAIPANGNGITTVADQLNATNPRAPELAQQTGQTAQNGGLTNISAFGIGSPGAAQNGGIGNQGSLTSGNQLNAGGGIAGVASKAEGRGIKLVNEQKKYNLWEFYYDLRKDQTQGASAGLAATMGTPNGGSGNNSNGGTFGQNQSTFGQNQSTFGQNQSTFGTGNGSTFSNSSSFGNSSGFGSSSTPQAPQPPQQTQTPPQ